jgi:hypothetical protein
MGKNAEKFPLEYRRVKRYNYIDVKYAGAQGRNSFLPCDHPGPGKTKRQ